MQDSKSKARILREIVRSYTYVLIWMGISIAVILFNKWLLAFSGFPFPIALTVWHMLFCSFVGVMAVRVLKVVKSHNMTPREYFKRVMPIGTRVTGQCTGLLRLLGRRRLFFLDPSRMHECFLRTAVPDVSRPALCWLPVALKLVLPLLVSLFHPGNGATGLPSLASNSIQLLSLHPPASHSCCGRGQSLTSPVLVQMTKSLMPGLVYASGVVSTHSALQQSCMLETTLV
jgi:hypothetical protein